AEFAEMVRHAGLGWIGPRAEMIRMMGNKIRAKEAMKEAGLPQLPGSEGVVQDERDLARLAERIGFPVILKATAGGGGRAMRKVRYNNVGTIEFLLDERSDFYFMEMNTRIQVEHPVTESVTGLDLIKEQIRLAAGEELGRTQKSIVLKGHAIECRVNAEDPVTFAPSPGLITAYNSPGGLGVRIDSAAYEQYRVLPFYDSMVAKLIVFADSRPAAIM